jgi:hypothetical protein
VPISDTSKTRTATRRKRIESNPQTGRKTPRKQGRNERVENRGISVAFRALSGPFGYATDKGETIAIDNTFPTGQQAKTLAHELAHCAIHFGKTDQATRLTRDIAELEAESIAYVVCKHFALDAEVRSSRYIALWNGNSKALRESLDRVSSTARALIDDLERAAGGTDVADVADSSDVAGKAVAA